jgi:hypothetical protein
MLQHKNLPKIDRNHSMMIKTFAPHSESTSTSSTFHPFHPLRINHNHIHLKSNFYTDDTLNFHFAPSLRGLQDDFNPKNTAATLTHGWKVF